MSKSASTGGWPFNPALTAASPAPAPAAATVSFPPLGGPSTTPAAIAAAADAEMDQACDNAVKAFCRQPQTAEMLKRWLDVATSHMLDLGFKLGAGGVVAASGRKAAFGQELGYSALLRDSVSGRPMNLRVTCFVGGGRRWFGRVEVKLSLHCLGVRTATSRSKAHTLIEMPMFSVDADPDLVHHGELTLRLRRHLDAKLQEAFPGGFELVFMEFAARVDELLAK